MTYEPNLPNITTPGLLADTDGLGEFQFRSYRIVEGEVTQEKVPVVEAY